MDDGELKYSEKLYGLLKQQYGDKFKKSSEDFSASLADSAYREKLYGLLKQNYGDKFKKTPEDFHGSITAEFEPQAPTEKNSMFWEKHRNEQERQRQPEKPPVENTTDPNENIADALKPIQLETPEQPVETTEADKKFATDQKIAKRRGDIDKEAYTNRFQEKIAKRAEAQGDDVNSFMSNRKQVQAMHYLSEEDQGIFGSATEADNTLKKIADLDNFAASNGLDEKQTSLIQKELVAKHREDAENVRLAREAKAKAIDEKIAEVSRLLAIDTHPTAITVGSAMRSTESLVEELKNLEQQKKDFFKSPEEATQELVESGEITKEEADKDPQKVFEDWYQAAYEELNELYEKYPDVRAVADGDMLRGTYATLKRMTVGDSRQQRYFELDEKVKRYAPVALINAQPYIDVSKDQFLNVAFDSAMNSFFNKKYTSTELEGAQNMLSDLIDLKVSDDVAVLGELEKSAGYDPDKGYEGYGLKDAAFWGQLTGNSLAMMGELALTAPITELAIGRVIGGADLLKFAKGGVNPAKLFNRAKFLGRLAKTRMGGTLLKAGVTAAEYQTAGLVFESGQDELHWLGGMLGSFGEQAMSNSLGKGGFVLQQISKALFKDKVDDFVKLISDVGEFTVRSSGRGFGEMAEEVSQDIAGLIRESNGDFFKLAKERYGSLKPVSELVVGSFVSGFMFGSMSVVGSMSMSNYEKQLEALKKSDPEQAALVEKITGDMLRDGEKALNASVDEKQTPTYYDSKTNKFIPKEEVGKRIEKGDIDGLVVANDKETEDLLISASKKMANATDPKAELEKLVEDKLKNFETKGVKSPQVTEETPKDGQQNEKFFTGKAKEASSSVPYEPVIKIDRESPVAKAYDTYSAGGNFTGHISKMIAGFQEKQTKVGEAIVKSGAKRFLDIGASEGGLVKTVASQDPSMKAVAVDPNSQMKANFNSTPEVKNAEFRQEAFQGSWTEEDGTFIPRFEAEEKFDVINEDFTFQFVNNDRATQVKGVKELLNDDGVFISSEKFFTDNFDANETKKADHQSKYFSAEERTKDKEEIIVGMSDDMVSDRDYIKVLKENFKYVAEFWNAGNFKGYIASDNLEKLNEYKENIGDLTTEFSDVKSVNPDEVVVSSARESAKETASEGRRVAAQAGNGKETVVQGDGDTANNGKNRDDRGRSDTGDQGLRDVRRRLKQAKKHQGGAVLETKDNKLFHEAITNAKQRHSKGASVHAYAEEEYRDMKLYVSPDGMAGAALKKDGDLVSVFSISKDKSAVKKIMIQAIKDGAKKLDGFDTILPDLYMRYGFWPVARDAWNENEKPKGWRHEDFIEYNNGRPDVVYMVYNGGDRDTIEDRIGTFPSWKEVKKDVPYMGYGDAVKAQEEAINPVKTKPTEAKPQLSVDKSDIEKKNKGYAAKLFDKIFGKGKGKSDTKVEAGGNHIQYVPNFSEKDVRPEFLEMIKQIIPLKDILGKRVNFVMADALTVDTKYDLYGGILFPYIQKNLKAGIVWASKGKEAAAKIIKGAKEADYSIVFSIGDTGIQSNKAIGDKLFDDAKEKIGKDVDEFLQLLRDKKAKVDGVVNPVVSEKRIKGIINDAKSIDDLRDGFDGLSLEDRASMLNHIFNSGKTKTSSVNTLGKFLDDKGVAHLEAAKGLVSEPVIDNARVDQNVAMTVLKIDGNSTPLSRGYVEKAGGQVHPNYDYYIKGKPMGIIEGFVPITDLVGEGRGADLLEKQDKSGSTLKQKRAALGIQARHNPQIVHRLAEEVKVDTTNALVTLLKKAFPNIGVSRDGKRFNELQGDLNAKKLTTKNQTVYGMLYDGVVYLNPDFDVANTPIHEFAHVWIESVREADPALYQKGIDLIKNSPYYEKIKNSPEYQRFKKNMTAEEFEQMILEEALATAIGDRGEAFVSESKKRNFKNWIGQLFDWVKKIAGISKLSSEEVQNLNMDKFLDAVVADLLSGEQISDVKSEELTQRVAQLSTDAKPNHEKLKGLMTELSDKYDAADIIAAVSKKTGLSITEVESIYGKDAKSKTAQKMEQTTEEEYKSLRDDAKKNPNSIHSHKILDENAAIEFIEGQTTKEKIDDVLPAIHDLANASTNNALILQIGSIISDAIKSGDNAAATTWFRTLTNLGTPIGQWLHQFAKLKDLTAESLVDTIAVSLALDPDMKAKKERDGFKFDPEQIRSLLTEKQYKNLLELGREYKRAQVAHKEALKKLRKNPTDDNLKEFSRTRRELAANHMKIANAVNRLKPKGIANTFVQIMQGAALTVKSLIVNPVANFTFMPVMSWNNFWGDVITSLSRGIKTGDWSFPFFGSVRWNSWFHMVDGVKAWEEAATGNVQSSYDKLEIRHNLNAFQVWSDVIKHISGNTEGTDMWQRGKSGKIKGAVILEKILEGTAGINADIMFRGLHVGDKAFRGGAEMAEVYRMAKEKKQKMKKPTDLYKFMATMSTEEMERVKEAGQRAVFAEKRVLSNAGLWLVNGLNKRIDQIDGGRWYAIPLKTILKMFVKSQSLFVTIPLNLIEETLLYALPPLSIAGMVHSLSTGNTHAAGRYLGRVFISGALYSLASMLHEAGIISVIERDDDKSAKGLKHESGKRNGFNYDAFSRLLMGLDPAAREGDTVVDFGKIGIVGMFLGYYAELRETLKENDEEWNPFDPTVWSYQVGAAFDNGMNQSFMQGAMSIAQAINNKDANYWLAGTAKTILGVFAPNNFVNSVIKPRREFMVDTKSDDLGQWITNDFSAKWFSEVEGTTPYVSIWGEIVPQTKKEMSGVEKFLYHTFNILDPMEIPDKRTEVLLRFAKKFDDYSIGRMPQKQVNLPIGEESYSNAEGEEDTVRENVQVELTPQDHATLMLHTQSAKARWFEDLISEPDPKSKKKFEEEKNPYNDVTLKDIKNTFGLINTHYREYMQEVLWNRYWDWVDNPETSEFVFEIKKGKASYKPRKDQVALELGEHYGKQTLKDYKNPPPILSGK